MEAHAQISRGQWPVLDIAGDPKSGAATVTALSKADRHVWYTLDAGLMVDGLQIGTDTLFRMGAAPATPDAAAAYCFAWPLSDRDPTLGRIMHLYSGQANFDGLAWSIADVRGCGRFLFTAHCTPTGLEATLPLAIYPEGESGKWSKNWTEDFRSLKLDYRPLRDADKIRPATVPAIPEGVTDASRSAFLAGYLDYTINPVDARLGAALQSVELLVTRAARRSNAFPQSAQEMQLEGGMRLLQLKECDSADADILVEFDGIQTYRYTALLATGERAVRAHVYYKLHPLEAVYDVLGADELQQLPPRHFEVVAAFKLLPPATSLPSADIAPYVSNPGAQFAGATAATSGEAAPTS
ncbi:MAG: hypothetical protein ABI743_03800 [bacterium]